MNRTQTSWLILAGLGILLASSGATCLSGAGNIIPVLECSYAGHLDLLYTQDLPPINATARMNVEVDPYGKMTFTTGTLSYDGQCELEESRLRRNGTINLTPTGSWFDNNGVDSFSVTENGTGTDRLRQWVFDGSTWQLVIDQTSPINWKGGLHFVLDDAVLEGSTTEVTTLLGKVRWTLHLTPKLN
jgi:hypothetical protein